jgi:hypothetical protein
MSRNSSRWLARAAIATGTLVLVVVSVGCTRRPSASPAAPAPRASAAIPAARAHDLYVSPTGDDTAPGSHDDPLATVDAALDRAERDTTIWLLPGRHEPFTVRGLAAGQAREITISATAEGAAVIDGGSASAAIRIINTAGIQLVGLETDGPAGSGHAGVRIERSHDIRLEGSNILGVRGGYGIEVRYSSDVTISGNDVAHNAVAVRMFGEDDPGSVHDILIDGNWLHDSDSMIVNDLAPDNDNGGNAISWDKVSGATIARDNQVWNNRAESHDYGMDGGAFEIWGSSNMEITGNTAWNNVNVLETGTDGPACMDIRFVRNTAFVSDHGAGLILRCAQDGLVAHNVLDSVEGWDFDLSDDSGTNQFASSIDGLRILDNILVGTLAYSVSNTLQSIITIDHNVLWNPGGPLAKLPGRRQVQTLADLTAATGYDADSVQADPLFVDAGQHDYHLRPGSPAIDLGLGVDDQPFDGTAPDAGRYEFGAASPNPS